MPKTIATIPNYTYQDTSNPNVKRFVDRDGNWTHYWLVEQKKFVKAVNHVIRLGYPKGARFLAWLKNATPEEADRKLLTAGEEGTRTHQAIMELTSGNKITMTTRYFNDLTKKDELLNDDEWDNLEAFINFCNTYQPEYVGQNETVFSTAYEFAGTLDLVCTLLIPEGDKKFPKEVHGKRVLVIPIDWKTSAAIYPEYALQVAAYFQAILEMGLYEEFIKSYPLFGAIVRIGTKHKIGYEVEVFSGVELANKFEVFRSCIVVANDQEPNFEPEFKEIPVAFYYKMKNAKTVGQKIASKLDKDIAKKIFVEDVESIVPEADIKKIKGKVKKGRGRPKKIK